MEEYLTDATGVSPGHVGRIGRHDIPISQDIKDLGEAVRVAHL